MRFSRTLLLLVAAGAVALGVTLGAASGGDPEAEPRAVSPACPVTLPGDGFTPPAPYRSTPSAQELVWYGTAGLWTALPADGSYSPRKSVWWSASFRGGAAEEAPAITVRWERLGSGEKPIVESPGTNAHTDEDGWFMIAGLDPDEPGCWRVTAEYRGETLSYTYLVR